MSMTQKEIDFLISKSNLAFRKHGPRINWDKLAFFGTALLACAFAGMMALLSGCGDQNVPLRNQACEDAASNRNQIAAIALAFVRKPFDANDPALNAKTDAFFSCYCVEKKVHTVYNCKGGQVNINGSELTSCMAQKTNEPFATCELDQEHRINGETGEIF